MRGKSLWSLLLPLSAHLANAHTPARFQEPSNHRVQFVAVDDGVRMEVLDWGGSGKAVVLLAGLGYTAHVSDDFAEKLAATRSCHARQREPPLSPNRPAAEPVKSS